MSRPLKDRVVIAVGSLGGIGFVPGLPGTAGTVAAVLIYLGLAHFVPPTIYVLMVLALIVAAIPIADRMNRIYHQSDCKFTVIDELVGFLAAMVWLPVSWLHIGLAFIFFRLFDILKPPPVRYFDRRVPGGLGVVLDDVVAGLMANIAIRLLMHLFRGSPL